MERLQLQVVQGARARQHDLLDGMSVGRVEGNDIVLDHPSVSRRHAIFQMRGDALWIVDLRSTNGVKLNGQPITEARISPGDTLTIGSAEAEVRAAPPVEFSESTGMFEQGGTVLRKISDFNLEFGLDAPIPRATSPGFEPAVVPEAGREKIFAVLVQVAKALLESDDLDGVLTKVMDILFRYLPIERGLIILFDEENEPIPKLARFKPGTGREDIPISRTILRMVADQQVSLLTSNALEDARLMGGKSIAVHGIRSAMCAPLWNRGRVIGAVQVDSPIYVGQFNEEDLDMLTALSNFAAVAVERAQLGEKIEHEKRIRAKLERYHSPGVVDEIVKGVVAADESQVRNADVTILFADISGFTTITETKQPEEVSEFLSDFFSCAVDAIFTYGGTLDKFIGDAVMAFFGAPIPQDDHAARAIRAGLMMRRLVEGWNARRAAQGLPAVNIRIGVNSGPAVVGNVGTETRVDYTVLGNSVNIASRLESGVAKPGQMVISQHTLDRAEGLFLVDSLGEFPLKGLQQRMPVYAVIGETDELADRTANSGSAPA
jgi:adenylate cyclase